MKQLLAHSAIPKKGVPAQSYSDHINSVMKRAAENAEEASQYLTDGGTFFVDVVRAAACLHDLGKLDAENQAILSTSNKKLLPVNHVDAGTARLRTLGFSEAALLTLAHHRGLCSILEESDKGEELFFRDPGTFDRTEKLIDTYLHEHDLLVSYAIDPKECTPSKWTGLTRRIALSCLVEADHGDTAQHYSKEIPVAPLKPQWRERIKALDTYVDKLFKENPTSTRNQLRREVYLSCRNADINPPMRACDSPVGTGKTTAVMAHLLQVAAAKNLRHIFVVLPYVNIIKQSVDIYRKALVLPGERLEETVAEHHHQADFEEIELRQLATLWAAPTIVTTAVQFFETLGSNHPSRLRKLHELAGSAIFIDETHAATPSWLWPQTWLWLKELTHRWGCHVVLASGSLPSFWELQNFINPPESIPALVPTELRQRCNQDETRRISYHRHEQPMNRQDLINFVVQKSGPRLVILNTVQSAAVVAKEMQKAGHSVLHISTSLTPVDRERIIERVLRRLHFKDMTDWTLVATSCVEAGMNFSFRTAFRESCSTTSLIQIGGRANRHGNDQTAEVWDFRVLDPLLNRHPAFDTSRKVLDELFGEGSINSMTATEIVTEAMRREIMSDYGTKAEMIKKSERVCDYPEVAKLCRVIDADTRIVVVEPEIIHALEKRERISSLELLRNSVQIWFYKIGKLALQQVRGYEELYKWTGRYDPDFIGYMEDVLPLIYAQEVGLIV